MKETKNEHREELSQATKREKSSGNVANLVQRMSTIGIPTGGFLPQPPPAAKSKFLQGGLQKIIIFPRLHETHKLLVLPSPNLSWHFCIDQHSDLQLTTPLPFPGDRRLKCACNYGYGDI